MRTLYFILILIGIAATSCSPLTRESTEVTLQEIQVPAVNTSAEPFLYIDEGVVHLSWVEKQDTQATFRISRIDNMQWSDPTTIAAGNSWFVNWADYPMVASKGKNMIAHFLDKSGDGKFAYDIKLTTSDDGGKSWQTPILLNDDKKEAEHGFVTLLPYNNDFFVTWLDGRNTAMEGMDHHEGHHGSMSLRAAIVDYSGNKKMEWELDNKTCDCCQTTAAITSSGPVVIYRDRSDDEIRDMSIVRLVDGKWTSPKPIHDDNWKIAGCPVNGPRAATTGKTLAVVWFSAASEKSRVLVAFSENHGMSFNDPIRIDEGKTIGRVDIDMIDENNALVVWMEGAEIRIVKINKDGTKGPSTLLASSSDSRASGFPQLVINGDQAIVAWTDDKEKKVRTASLEIPK
jgi:hypothetical protein